MKKSLLLLICSLLLTYAFADLITISPKNGEFVETYPIKFEWQFDGPFRERTYSTYSLYVGSEKGGMELIANNLSGNEKSVFKLPKFNGQTVYWKVIKEYIDGESLESDIAEFVFTPNPKKVIKVEKQVKDPGEIKIVLTWQDKNLDLDSILVGELPNGEYFRMFRSLAEFEDGSHWPDYVTLDYLPNKENYGAEVTTLKEPLLDSVYKFTVRDYTNKFFDNSDAMSFSNVVVAVYQNDLLINQFSIPVNKKGCYWNVFEMIVTKYGEIEFSTINSFFDYYSGVVVTPTKPATGIDVEKTIKPIDSPVLPPTVKGKIPKYFEINRNELQKLLNKAQIYHNSDKYIHAIKMILPAGVELEATSVSVYVNGKAVDEKVLPSNQLKTEMDIMLVVDTTGSMVEEIKGIQNSLKAFVGYLNEQSIEVRIGMVPYDDYAPSNYYGWKDLSGYKETLEFINRFMKLSGGNEIPYTAIDYAVRHADWSKDAERHIILVTDEFSESGAKFETISKENLIKRLSNKFTAQYIVHSILSTDGNYKTDDKVYDEPGDPREFSEKTKGVIEYIDEEGNINLAESGLLTFMDNAWYIFFETKDPVIENLDVYFNTSEGKSSINY